MIDQLRKKKFLEELSGRVPAQIVPTEGSEPTIEVPPIDVDADLGGDQLLIDADQSIVDRGEMPRIAKPRQERQADNVQADMMVGASQALLGLLSGNHNRTVMGFNKANKYVSDRRTEDRKDLSTLVKTNQGGKPVYTPSIEAADMEAYVAPSKVGANGAAGSFQLAQLYDPATDTYSSIKHNSRTGEILDLSNAPITPPPGVIVRPVAPRTYNKEDVQGNKTYSEKSPYKAAPKPFDSSQGTGSYYGVGTKGQAENLEKAQERGQKESEAISGSIVDAKAAEDTIKNSNDPRAISAAIYSLTRSVEPKGVLTEQDFQVISGNSFMPTLEEINQFISKKGTGELSGVKASYLGLAKNIRERLQKRLDSVPSRFGANQTPAAKKGVENTIPKSRAGSAKNKAAYIQAKSAAERRWGPKSGTPRPDVLEKYLEQKKMDLGIE